MKCFWLLLLCGCLLVQAQQQMNLEQLVEFLRSELALKRSTDKQIAATVRKVELTEKLTDKTILDLEAQGAGPRTVDALKELRDKTKAQKPPAQDVTSSPATEPDNTLTEGPKTSSLSTTQAPAIPPPTSVEQQKILDSMKEYALHYTQSLPNFMCVQVTRRYVDPGAQDHYRGLGTILARVGYNEGIENYKVYSMNGKLVDTTMENVRGGGASSTGEFGSLMREIFEPRSDAEFNWDHWATLRGRRMAVFNYFIDSGHSGWYITYGGDSPQDEQRIKTAYRGLVYADPDTGEIDRIKFEAVDIPRTFPITATTEILDYDLTDISGQKYVCPMAAKLWIKTARETAKNEIEFRNYRKFNADYNIKYDMDLTSAAPLPASKTEEEPVASNRQSTAKTTAPQAKPTTSASPWTLPSAPPPPPQ